MASKQKILFLALWLALLSFPGWRLFEAGKSQLPKQAPAVLWVGAPPDRVVLDPELVFQRAFWASPTSEDKILHAERREWSDADGVLKWEWFLVVEPSPALLKRLRDDNAFGLIPAASAAATANTPGWFRFDADEVKVLKSPQAKLQLIFDKNHRTLYATDSGLGFRSGAPEPIKPTPQQAPVLGRLPTTPPRRPQP
jgi:hypothetical protein